jgi:hypothetical protein
MKLRFFPSDREDRSEEFKPKKVSKILDPKLESEEFIPKKVEETIPPQVVFIDGVRRTEFRVSIFEGNTFVGEGIFISIGSGALLVDFTTPRVEYKLLHSTVKRFFITNVRKEDIPPFWRFDTDGQEVRFETIYSPLGDISAYANYVMKKLEVETLKRISDKNTFVVMDGPVKLKKFLDNVVYLVKDSHYYYIEGFEEILFRLRRGERTPAFLFEESVNSITEKGIRELKISKAGCYVKLLEPYGGLNFENPFWGIARLEVPSDGKKENLVKTLKVASSIACRFANHPLRDSRAPQNLTTIAHLEKELRRRLGKYEIIRRGVGNLLLSYLS